jgi:hypothetical protein
MYFYVNYLRQEISGILGFYHLAFWVSMCVCMCVCVCVYMCVCVFVCQHDNSRNTQHIHTKFFECISHRLRKSWLKFGWIWLKIEREMNKSLSCFSRSMKKKLTECVIRTCIIYAPVYRVYVMFTTWAAVLYRIYKLEPKARNSEEMKFRGCVSLPSNGRRYAVSECPLVIC